MATEFQFDLVSPERNLMSAQITQAIVPGREGEFTVMANHAPFLSTLRPGVITVEIAGGTARKFFVRSGLADVNETTVTILAQQALALDGATSEQIQAERAHAESVIAAATDDERVADAHATLSALAGVS